MIKKLIPSILIFTFVFSASVFVLPKITEAQTNQQIVDACGPNSPKKFNLGTDDYIACANNLRAQYNNPDNFYGPQQAKEDLSWSGWWDTIECAKNPLDCALRNFVATIVTTILQLVSLLTGVGGLLLNGVILHTVVNISKNYTGLTVINEAWKAIRDVSNMAFIFVLLYAAIQTILGIGRDVKGLIVRVIVIAVLINFSLFFTKFVIDTSNILALTFYDAIVPNSAVQGLTDVNVNFSIDGATNGLITSGLSSAFMKSLNLQSLYSVPGQTISFGKIIVTGVMGSILLLIAAFIFIAVALMFIIRYVILIMVLIFSPIAFVASILPEKKYQSMWVNALVGQAFFAPIYFMLTWVTLRILGGITQANIFGANASLASVGDAGWTGTFINYIVVIVFLITSLVVAKDWADRAPGGVGKLTSWALGAAGSSTLGIGGRLGRKTIGSWGGNTLNDENLKARARAGDMSARLKLATASRISKASFDMRATGIGATLGAGKGQKGGWAQDQKDSAKNFEKYKPSGDAIKKIKENEERHQKELDSLAERAITKSDEHIDDENYLKELRRTSTKGMSDEAATAHAAKIKLAQEKVDEHQKELIKKRKSYAETSDDSGVASVRFHRDFQADERKSLENSMENMAKTSENRGRTLKFWKYAIPGSGYVVGGKDRAAAIRAAAKGKSKKDKALEAVKDWQEEEGGGKENEPKEEGGEGGEKKPE